jgi:uncharacterized protein (DUF4415 family)
MKRRTSKYKTASAGKDMLPEYDFRGGVRGKHYQACRDGYTVKIHNEDGTTTVQNYVIQEGTVKLDPDVRAYFRDAGKVNAALRAIIAVIPAERRGGNRVKRSC